VSGPGPDELIIEHKAAARLWGYKTWTPSSIENLNEQGAKTYSVFRPLFICLYPFQSVVILAEPFQWEAVTVLPAAKTLSLR
jgi:hypothetical protein